MGTGPRALLLDVDDTLVDTRAAMVAAAFAAAASLWPHEPPEVHHRAGSTSIATRAGGSVATPPARWRSRP